MFFAENDFTDHFPSLAAHSLGFIITHTHSSTHNHKIVAARQSSLSHAELEREASAIPLLT